MNFSLGVDGCKKGYWLAFALDKKGGHEIERFPNIEELWQRYREADMILIDTPIGLPDKGDRQCDIEARSLLRNRASSVFPVPCRKAVYAESYEKARAVNGKGFSIQTWCITPRIRQVDTFLLANKSARLKVKEVHPELCFRALNKLYPSLNSKHVPDGIMERLRVLSSVLPESEKIYSEAERGFLHKEVARDDILDALVAAFTALHGDSLRTIPEKPDLDSYGLPMQISYYEPG